MILYHGTSQMHLDAILRDGLLPRNQCGVSNWKHTIESRGENVYLTSAYGLYFAASAGGDAEIEDSFPVVLMIDVERHRLWPDEDVIAQVRHHNNKEAGGREALLKLTRDIDPRQYNSSVALETLRLMGTCCTEAIEPSRIVGYAIVRDRALLMDALAPSISLANFLYKGAEYRQLMRYLFGYDDHPVVRLVAALASGKSLEAFGAEEKNPGLDIAVEMTKALQHYRELDAPGLERIWLRPPKPSRDSLLWQERMYLSHPREVRA